MDKKPIVKNYMATRLVILSETMDVYFAIALLLKNKISGAPVINDANELVGILSEKDCLRVFANGSFHNMPGGDVGNFMTKAVATVTPEMELFMVADIFLKHNYRRRRTLKLVLRKFNMFTQYNFLELPLGKQITTLHY